MKHCHESLIDFPVVVTIPVIWGDHDNFGHVNNLAYLRWSETARVEYLMRIDFWPPLPPAGRRAILASISCDYKRVMTFPDTAYVGARVIKIGNRSFQLQHRVVSKSPRRDSRRCGVHHSGPDYSRNQTVSLQRIAGRPSRSWNPSSRPQFVAVAGYRWLSKSATLARRRRWRSAPLNSRGKKPLDQFPGECVTNYPAPEADHVEIVVLDALVGGKDLMNQARPNPRHLVRGHRRLRRRSTDGHTAVQVAAGNCAGQRHDKIG